MKKFSKFLTVSGIVLILLLGVESIFSDCVTVGNCDICTINGDFHPTDGTACLVGSSGCYTVTRFCHNE